MWGIALFSSVIRRLPILPSQFPDRLVLQLNFAATTRIQEVLNTLEQVRHTRTAAQHTRTGAGKVTVH